MLNTVNLVINLGQTSQTQSQLNQCHCLSVLTECRIVGAAASEGFLAGDPVHVAARHVGAALGVEVLHLLSPGVRKRLEPPRLPQVYTRL